MVVPSPPFPPGGTPHLRPEIEPLSKESLRRTALDARKAYVRTLSDGDRVEIVIDAGSGTTRTYDVAATRAGRKVNVTHGRGVVEVSEVTRGGTTVRTARFLANRVLALVEHPAQDEPVADEITPSLRSV